MKITFLIPTINSEKFISKSINKLTKKIKNFNYEIIIINDFSSDNTIRIIKDKIKSNRNIKLINNKKREGQFNSLIKGMSKSKGDFIITLDDDEEFYYSNIKKIIRYGKKKKSFDVLIGYSSIDSRNLLRKLGRFFINYKNSRKQIPHVITSSFRLIKKNFAKKRITEISASKKLFEFRKKNKNFKFLSFPTISGSGSNGAIIHYKASKKTNRKLRKGDIYLVDSGGQYEFGTTDVTRTVSLGNFNNRIKNIFTRVLKGHIAVAEYDLKNSTSGAEIDIVARKYLKQIGLDYPHGTGHGVGYFLNVHEGPHAISKNNKIKLHEGMILSNEPGYYEQNKFGIRIENLIFVNKNKNKKYFENLTMSPIDKNLINKDLLNQREVRWLNNYHKKVYKNIKKYMSKNEILELNKACSSI